ncbi:two-CW domain-containing protein [Candidatus Latescibacterota bacterium]
MNCWEFKKCGREKGGAKSAELGVCAAYPNKGTDCARIAGTLCGGAVQGSFAMKLPNCMKCDFFKSSNYSR